MRDLFGAVPARRKFLRAESTEASHVAEALTAAGPRAARTSGFVLSSGGRNVIQAPPVDGLLARVHQVFGAAYADDLATVEGGQAWATVRGFARPPVVVRARARLACGSSSTAAPCGTGRWRAPSPRPTARPGVRDPRPEVLLFLDVPLHMVDVNVHPAKTEVRFAEPRTVWSAVEQAVRQALAAGARRAAPRVSLSGDADASPPPSVAYGVRPLGARAPRRGWPRQPM